MTPLARRRVLKVVHWSMVPLFAWFALIGPPEAHALGPWGFVVHSNLALVFVLVCLGWTGHFLWRGLETKRTPRLSPRMARVHWWMHRIIIWGLFAVALTGFALGLTSERLLKAGGFLPIAPPLDLPWWNEQIGAFHILEFYALGALIGAHALFHVWRHVRVGDNALKVMVPKALHRFL